MMDADTSPEVWVAHVQESLPPEPAMTVGAAYACLKAAPGSSWESIEQARRELVQLAHPERLVALSEEESVRARAGAARANAACELILRSRTARHRTTAN